MKKAVINVRNGRTLKVTSLLIDKAGIASHGVHGTGGIENVNVEEGDERQTELSAVSRDIPLLNVEDVLDLVEVDNLLEEVESIVADSGVGEVGNLGGAGPRDDGDENDTGDNGTLDAVHQEHGGENTTAENADPHGRVAHLVTVRAGTGNRVTRLGMATSKLDGHRGTTDRETDTLRVGHTDEGQEETNTDTGGQLDGPGDSPGQPLTHAKERKTEEHPAFNEDGSDGDLVGNKTLSVISDDGVREVGVQTHTGRKSDRPIFLSASQHLNPTRKPQLTGWRGDP